VRTGVSLRNPFRRKQVIWDYSQILENLACDLESMREHVRKNCYHADQDEKVAELTKAIAMARSAATENLTDDELARFEVASAKIPLQIDGVMQHNPERSDISKEVYERHEREWVEFTDYLRDNMRKWWC